jgi:hypothetical protein
VQQHQIHPLLERQLRKSGLLPVPDALTDFVAMVNASYDIADARDAISGGDRLSTPPAELLHLLTSVSAAPSTCVDGPQ